MSIGVHPWLKPSVTAWFRLSLGLTLFLAAITGCGKSAPPSTNSVPPSTFNPQPSTASALRLHWLGKKRLAAETNATNFMAIWNLPESAKLEAQTLDKLATAPWRLLATAPPLSNAPTALLRPLLDDLVAEESYLEVQAVTNQPNAYVLAIRLAADRAALWRTNLPVILQSLFAAQLPSPNSHRPNTDFSLQTSDFRLVMSRSGDWTLLSLTDLRLAASDFGLLEQIRSRIAATQAPYPPRTTNYWLETELDLRALHPANQQSHNPTIHSPLPPFPRLSLTVIGDGQNVRTRGELSFSGPLPIELEPWNIPTNLVHDPLIGFMAMRGIRPWLAAWKFWSEPQLGTPPNQAFFWAQEGTAPLHFFAMPSVQASNLLHHLSEFLINDVNPLFASSLPTNGIRLGSFERIPNSEQIRWRGVPMISPKTYLADAGANPFITGGLFSNLITNRPAPAELLRQFQTDPNLVFYDWEITQPGAYRLIQVTQVGRLVFGRARLSMTNNAALPWLVAISPKLGVAGTSIRLADPNRLTFSRSSTLGLTGVELHLLADWLESPLFPKGFFTLTAKPMPLRSVPPPTTKPSP